MLTMTEIQTLLNGNCDKNSRLLLTHAESIVRNYEVETISFMRNRTIEELDHLHASLYPKQHKPRIQELNELLSVLDLILNHNEEGVATQ